MKIDWGWPKAVLLFFGLIAKGLSVNEPLPIPAGELIKTVSNVLWIAFDGAFLWLLQPPKQKVDDNSEEV
jgi:hypothetical protein